ncbi:MAG: deoxyribodipyrimidine photo-lyase [Thermoplasmatota archaeon]
MSKFKTSLFIFRRDLRLHDNTALLHALKQSEKVIPLFIIDDLQQNHPYFSSNAFEFMINSLKELKKQIQKKGSGLLIIKGEVLGVLNNLKKDTSYESIHVNQDYTPFSKKRDASIAQFCQQKKISFYTHHDCLLNTPGEILNNQQKMFKIFKSFKQQAMKKQVEKPKENSFDNYADPKINQLSLDSLIKEKNPHLFLKGGSSEAVSLLKLFKNKDNYTARKDFMYSNATSKLSAHLKFGTISIREVYQYIKNNFSIDHEFISQLYWRDFFHHIADSYPDVFGNAGNKKLNKIKWWGSKQEFKAWKKGETGYPLVDAGMRQLQKTGWMHGRVRMITACFLVKNLGIDWRLGEQYFAQNLIDYDPCVNNGNWQWVASTGHVAQPYFRIFNPFLQQQKYDPECLYIKEWVDELKQYDKKRIHTILSNPISGYNKPIIDYKKSIKKSNKAYKNAFHA